MKSSQSLSQYLNQSYIIILALLTAAFMALVIVMNWSGMDETTEYYMLYEAEVLTEYYQPHAKIAEFDPGKKEYYWGSEQLPAQYQALITDTQAIKNQVSLYVTDNAYIYILPYELKQEHLTFYVIHLFPLDDTNTDQTFKHGVIVVVTIILLLVIFFVFRINTRVTAQVALLDGYMAVIAAQDTDQFVDVQPPEKLSFKELREAASRLQISMQAQYELRQKEQQFIVKEKAFLSSLSHELRTPIAVISTAIALLKKRGQLAQQDSKVLEKLSKANSNIKLMTETLLQLWRKQKPTVEKSKIYLSELVAQLINDRDACHWSEHWPEANFTINGVSSEAIVVDKVLLEICLSNLLRNACQYSLDTVVNVTVDNNQVNISNLLTEQLPAPELNYGYGLGLYLVETICQQQGWQFNASATDERFTVILGF